MKSHLILISTFFFGFVSLSSAQNFQLPKGYSAFKDYNGNQQRMDADFDKDGVNDLAIVCTSKKGEMIVVVYLASKWMVNRSYWWFPWEENMNSFEFNNNVLTFYSSHGNGRHHTAFKFKYYADLADIKVIGYDEENFGNAANEGAYKKSVNLNTGEYEINGIKRRVDIGLITLTNIENYFDYLSSLGQNYLN